MIKKGVITHRGVWKEKILNIITKHPGIYFRQIYKKLKKPPIGTLTRHLHTLEKQGRIISIKHKKFDYKYYWIKEQYNQQQPLIQSRMSHIRFKIYELIRNNPGIIQKQIIIQVQRKQSTISYHVNKMRRKKIITCRAVGKTKRYYLIKKQ